MKGEILVMYFSNLVGEESFGKLTRKNGYDVVIEERESVSNAYCFRDGAVLRIASEEGHENLFTLRGNPSEVVTPKKGLANLTYMQVMETEDNPLIVVLCRKIRFYHTIKTFVKTINMGDDLILAMLVYGAADFSMDDEWVPMQRCNTQSLEGKETTEYSAKDLQRWVVAKTPGGYDKTYDIVNAFVVDNKKDLIQFKMIKGECTPIYSERIADVEKAEEEAEKQRMAQKAAEAEAKKKRHEEWLKERELRRKAEAAEEAERKRAKAAGRKTAGKEIKTPAGEKRNAGAAAFLAFVRGN